MILQGNSIRIPLADESVHAICTSPPYWALRDYGTAKWAGGSGECDHKATRIASPKMNGVSIIPINTGDCLKCGATRIDDQIGLEPTIAAYIAVMVQVFREVWRVLRPDGVCFVNLGDSYSGGKNGRSAADTKAVGKDDRTFRDKPFSITELPAKNLCMIPARVALALQDDGWVLRSEIPWLKANAMPSSVTDRPGTAHEHVFMLVKSARYYYDGESVRRGYAALGTPRPFAHKGNGDRNDTGRIYEANNQGGRALRTSDPFFDSLDAYIAHLQDVRDNGGMLVDSEGLPAALVVNTESYSQAHYACVDEETECLTASGWKDHKELESGELIAGFDLGTGLLSWEPVKAIHRYEVDNQEMVSIGHRDLSVMVTPNHRCVVRKRTPDKTISSNYRVIRADEINSRCYIPIAAPWEELIRGIASDSHSLLLAELCGWYVTEGYAKENGAIGIDQSLAVNLDKVERIRYLLTSLDVDFTERITKRIWRGRCADMARFRLRGPVTNMLRKMCPDKSLPIDCLKWGDDVLRALFSSIVAGDGSVRKDDGRVSIIQKSKPFIDMVQAIAIRLGHTAVINQRLDGMWTCNVTNRPYRSVRGTNGSGTTIGTERYSGVVWCPETPLTTFVARRRGRVFITGNTFPRKLISPLIKTTPEKVCGNCGAAWVRVVVASGGTIGRSWHNHKDDLATGQRAENAAKGGNGYKRETTGWQPTCRCIQKRAPNFGMKGSELLELADEVIKELAPIGGIVLDPFAGSGTVGEVCRELGRRFIGIDLSARYLAENALARSEKKTSAASLGQLPMFATLGEAA